ncbi:thioredoxin family protein [Candidatus Bipolaricaulota bacterium]|nr:thioredoxin family protein [Candidatus Bipolaricaulota bacterium]
MRKYILVAVLLSLILVYPVFGNESADIADNYRFETALRLSRVLDRQLVFSFVSSGCAHCQEFKDQILSDPAVKELFHRHFVLSLVSLDSKFDIELPEKGTVTNFELASSLGVEYTPTTYFFYPPNPGLEGNGIVKVPGNVSDPKKMVDLLNRALTDSFQEGEGTEEAEVDNYNYETSVKEISREDSRFLQENMKDGLTVVNERKELSEFPQEEELVLNFPLDDLETYAGKVLSDTPVKKVYIVKFGGE